MNWLSVIAEQRHRSPATLMWVGDQLRLLGSAEAATRAYGAAEVATVDARLKSELQVRSGSST